MTSLVQKISDDSFVDLTTLTVTELNRLHFEEESYTAEKVRQTAPFSTERAALLKRGYALVHAVMQEKGVKQGQVKKAFGANRHYCSLVKNEIRHIRKRKKNVLFFEAGVGGGLVLDALRDENDLRIMGCDFCIEKKLADDPRFELYEGTIDQSLQRVEDSSIDLFYWNDVLEHILDDEIDQYMNLIRRKMADRGTVITITPNKHVGPGDISRLFLPPGSRAAGFHFHEYSFHELYDLWARYGFRTKRCVFLNPLTKAIWNGPRSSFGIRCVESLRRSIELVAPVIYPMALRKVAIYVLGSFISINEKSSYNVQNVKMGSGEGDEASLFS